MDRLCIYAKDIQIITGKSIRYCRDLIKKIREACGKQNHQLVTIDEFCEYTGLCPEEVKAKLFARNSNKIII